MQPSNNFLNYPVPTVLGKNLKKKHKKKVPNAMNFDVQQEFTDYQQSPITDTSSDKNYIGGKFTGHLIYQEQDIQDNLGS